MEFKKAQASSDSNGCVEVAVGGSDSGGGRYVRDSKDPNGAMLHFTEHEWACFLDGARNGEFS